MRYYVVILMCLFSFVTDAQTKIKFAYDNAGNQVSRILCINCEAKPTKEINAIASEDLQKFSEEDVISYYPNPVKEELYLQWKLTQDNYVTSVQVFSISGQTLATYKGNNTIKNVTIPFQSFPSGVYIVLVSYKAGEAKSIKIIKQ
nr:T9SS type A sorting domain-containing protein [uncultured Flavobacterium sp.]